MEKKDELVKIFSKAIRNVLGRLDVDFEDVQEIRLRVLAPLLVIYKNTEYYLTHSGRLSGKAEDAYVVSREEVRETMEYISHYSLYAYEEEMKQGFITIQGGHRIGIAGKTIVDDKGIRSMKYVSFINVRLSHQVKGCASAVLPSLYHGGDIFHTLVISPPRCGKTTLLRDMIRQISNGTGKEPGMTVGVIDERSEIGACYQGVPQNELGIRTDILDCCPKARGMMMLIRT
ncbi:MAG: stage III sporulation protein AA, partial [Hungatella hathewayi]